jgi:hypothetical protein
MHTRVGYLQRTICYGAPVPRESPPICTILETALDLHRRSLRLVPLCGKRAIIKDWPSLHLSERDIRDWSTRGVNWGIITGEPLVVLDTDTNDAEAWVYEHGVDSPVIVRSGGGGLHRYFRCTDGVEVHSRSAVHRIDGLDVKGWRSYIVAPGSVHPETKRRYEYLPGRSLGALKRLPLFDPEWVREIRVEPFIEPRTARPGGTVHSHIHDMRAYIRAIPSLQGQGGDRACFRVACLLVEAGFDYASALAEITAWNEVAAIPPWKNADLERKIRRAFQRVLGITLPT